MNLEDHQKEIASLKAQILVLKDIVIGYKFQSTNLLRWIVETTPVNKSIVDMSGATKKYYIAKGLI